MPGKILIVDDDHSLCEVLKYVLADEAYEVKTLNSTENVILEIFSYQPQLILMDYILPGTNGGELCRQIKANPDTQSLAVVLYSVYPKARESCGNYFDAYIEKPFDLWMLIEMINLLLLKGDADSQTG